MLNIDTQYLLGYRAFAYHTAYTKIRKRYSIILKTVVNLQSCNILPE